MFKYFLSGFLMLGFGFVQAQNQALEQKFHQLMFGNKTGIKGSTLHGHSHNDYKQDVPFFKAYYAGMESIEADVFLKDGQLYVAHEEREIQDGRTLEVLYLKPLYERFKANGGQVFADSSKSLQLVIDIKEDHQHVIPALIKILQPYMGMVADNAYGEGVRIVLSGDMPAPNHYVNYPDFISFDGRPNVPYQPDELGRIAMISNDMGAYTHWNGKGRLKEEERQKMHAVVEAAQKLGKPFRFWATPDSKNTWIELEKLGVTWINTDHPEELRNWLDHQAYNRFSLSEPLSVYKPTYRSDGLDGKVKNVILLIGDGMGLAQIKAALSANHGALNMANMRYMGLSRTESANAGNTDSGAGASAIATGQSTNNEFISVDTVGKPLPRISDILAGKGWKTGVLSTGDITDATPAAFYAANKDRNASGAIAQDLLNSKLSIAGGTAPGFFKEANQRAAYLKQAKAHNWVIGEDVAALMHTKADHIALFLPDAATRPVKDGRGALLQQLLRQSIQKLNIAKTTGFFLMAEGAQIDYGGHANDLPYVITEALDFDQAVGEALRFADQDGQTLVVVTADHETGGLTLLDADEEKGYVQGDFSTNDHTNIMVPVMAYGPHAQDFIGVYKNTELFNRILAAVDE